MLAIGRVVRAVHRDHADLAIGAVEPPHHSLIGVSAAARAVVAPLIGIEMVAGRGVVITVESMLWIRHAAKSTDGIQPILLNQVITGSQVNVGLRPVGARSERAKSPSTEIGVF